MQSSFDIHFKGITSSEGVFDSFSVAGQTSNGVRNAELSARQDLGATLNTTVSVDGNPESAQVSLRSDIRNFRPGPEESMAATSVFAQQTGTGNSEAALAGSANGQIYLGTGIIWRSWAALATGGLSLLGESFIKRVLSSARACDHLKEDLQKLVCAGDTPAASSPPVCPAVAS